MMKKKKKKYQLFLVCIVTWMILFFILIYQSPESNLTFFNTVVMPPSIKSFMSLIDARVVKNSTITEHLTKIGLARSRSIIFSPVSKDLRLGESWADKMVRGLWMGWASSDMLISRLQKAKEHYSAINRYRVKYSGQRKERRDKKQLLCQLKQQGPIRTLTGSEEPFASLGWQKLVPHRPLEQAISDHYMTCAVVSSAGAIINSSLGREIDTHDAVLRFNAAPTEGYENDVGNKTTIRVINSQIMADPAQRFADSHLYKNITLVAWDPGPYSGNLTKWYMSPDYDLFPVYKEHRIRSPSQPIYILHPDFLWNLWNILQSNTQEKVHPNPPSSGFIGIILMMSMCKKVDVYEFIPSKRHTTLCHYYEHYHDFACTLGAYHPLLYEKLLIRRMANVSLDELMTKGKVTLPGFSQFTCS